MKKLSIRSIVLISILAIISLACGSFFSAEKDVDSSSQVASVDDKPQSETTQQEVQQPTPEATATIIEPTPTPVVLGEAYRSVQGGFSFSTIPGYQLEESFGLVNMMAPTADEASGPFLKMVGGLHDEIIADEVDGDATSADQPSEDEIESSESIGEENIEEDESEKDNETQADSTLGEDAFQTTGREDLSIAGYPAISMGLEGQSEEGETLTGRFIQVEISDTHQFSLLAAAPEERWQNELAPLTEAVIDSLVFLEPVPLVFDFDAFHETEYPTDGAASKDRLAGKEIRQWASEAYASSEAGTTDYSAFQAVGEPDTFECGEFPTAYATGNPAGKDWLELYYDEPVVPIEINVYQTSNPSQVVLLDLLDEDGNYHEGYRATPSEVDECPYILHVTIEDAYYEIIAVEVTVDQRNSGVWNQIDAVELIGYRGSDFWGHPEDQYTNYIYSPENLAAGDFFFEINGDINNVDIQEGFLQDQSSPDEYGLDLISQEGDYILSLYIPADSSGEIEMVGFSTESEMKSPSATLFASSTLFYADSGSMKLEVNSDNEFSGAFRFTAYAEDDEDKIVYVDGAFKQYYLELTK